MKRIRGLIFLFGWTALIDLALVEIMPAQEPAAKPPRDTPQRESHRGQPQLELSAERRNREHWEALSPAARQRLREIYNRFKELRPEVRERLLKQLRELSPDQRRRAIVQAREAAQLRLLNEESRRFLRRPPETGRRRPGDGLAQEKRPPREDRAGRRQRQPSPQLPPPPLDRLPPELRQKIAALHGAEKEKAIAEFFQEKMRRMIEKLPPAESQRLKHLPPREQMHFLHSRRERQFLSKTFREPRELRALLQARPADLRLLLDETLKERPGFFPDTAWERWSQLNYQEKVRTVRQILRMKNSALPNSPAGRPFPPD